MATLGVQFTGAEPMEMPAIGAVGEKAWRPEAKDGTVDARELDEALAILLLSNPDNPFKRVALKVARATDPTTPPAPAPAPSETAAPTPTADQPQEG